MKGFALQPPGLLLYTSCTFAWIPYRSIFPVQLGTHSFHLQFSFDWAGHPKKVQVLFCLFVSLLGLLSNTVALAGS